MEKYLSYQEFLRIRNFVFHWLSYMKLVNSRKVNKEKSILQQ